MTDVDKFINIFEGSYSAYGQTRKTNEFDERGKHKTKSFIIKQNLNLREENLKGALDNLKKKNKNTKNPDNNEIQTLLEDNQISRAVDLLRGIKLFSKKNFKKNKIANERIIKNKIS